MAAAVPPNFTVGYMQLNGAAVADQKREEEANEWIERIGRGETDDLFAREAKKDGSGQGSRWEPSKRVSDGGQLSMAGRKRFTLNQAFHRNRGVTLFYELLLGVQLCPEIEMRPSMRLLLHMPIGLCYFMAVPYVIYIKLLTGSLPKSLLIWIYYTMGNFPPVLCYFWSLLYGRRCVIRIVKDLHRRQLWMGMSKKIICRSIVFTGALQAVYLTWLIYRPEWDSLSAGLQFFFIFLGATFAFRLLLVFVVMELFFLDLKRVRYKMELLNDSTQIRTCELEKIVKAFVRIDIYLREGMDSWLLSVLGLIAVPLAVFVIQVVLTAFKDLSPQSDYFFLTYEGHYFAIAFFALWAASDSTLKWKRVSRDMLIRLCAGELKFTYAKENSDSYLCFVNLLNHASPLTLLDRPIDRRLVFQVLGVTTIAVGYMVEQFRKNPDGGF